MTEGNSPVWKSLWDLENELRSAARDAIFMRRDEAKQHMEEAKRHYQEALSTFKGEHPSGERPDVLAPKAPDATHKPTLANRVDQ